MAGDIQEKDYAEYQTSRIGMNLNEEKYGTLSSSVKELRVFGREFLEKYSIMNIFPVGMHTKDTDIIVHVIRRRDERTLRVKDCKGR